MESFEGEHLSNMIVFEFQHITMKYWMHVIKVSFSQPGWFDALKVGWNASDHGNTMGYKIPFIPPKVTATCNILNHTVIYSVSLLASIVVYLHLCSQNMSMNRHPVKAANMARPRRVFGTEQCHKVNSESSENSSQSRTGKDSRFGEKPINIIHRMGMVTSNHSHQIQALHSVISTLNSTWQTVRNEPPVQDKDIQVISHSGKDMTSAKVVMVGLKWSPPPHIPGRELSSPGAPRVPPRLPENHPVNLPTPFSSNPPHECPSSVPWGLQISLPTKTCQLPAEPWKAHVARIAFSPPSPVMSVHKYDYDDENNVSSSLGSAEGKLPFNLTQTKFCLKQFPKQRGRPTIVRSYSGKKLGGWFLGEELSAHNPGAEQFERSTRLPLYWETVVWECLEVLENWLSLDNFWWCRMD